MGGDGAVNYPRFASFIGLPGLAEDEFLAVANQVNRIAQIVLVEPIDMYNII